MVCAGVQRGLLREQVRSGEEGADAHCRQEAATILRRPDEGRGFRRRVHCVLISRRDDAGSGLGCEERFTTMVRISPSGDEL